MATLKTSEVQKLDKAGRYGDGNGSTWWCLQAGRSPGSSESRLTVNGWTKG